MATPIIPAQRAPKKMPNRGIKSKLRIKFETSPGVIHYLPELVEEFATDAHVIQQAISNMRREQEMNGQPLVHIPAQAWVFQPEARTVKPDVRMFEQIAVTKNGDLVLQDHEGNLFRAQEL